MKTKAQPTVADATAPPAWAADLVERACSVLDTQRRPVVKWFSRTDTPVELDGSYRQKYLVHATNTVHSITDFSAGQSDDRIICIWPGRLRKDQRRVILHEIAHWYTRGLHTAAFWDCAWVLYKKFMPRSLAWTLEAEAQYKTGALHAAIRAGILTPEKAASSLYLRKGVALLPRGE